MRPDSAALLSGIAIPKSRIGNSDYLIFKKRKPNHPGLQQQMEIFVFWAVLFVLKEVSVLTVSSMTAIQLVFKY